MVLTTRGACTQTDQRTVPRFTGYSQRLLGVGVRQLARLTGVSYGIIQRINEKVGQRTPDPLIVLFIAYI